MNTDRVSKEIHLTTLETALELVYSSVMEIDSNNRLGGNKTWEDGRMKVIKID